MDIIYILLPVSVFLALLGIVAYFWSVKSGQFDDLDTPQHRMLLDDDQEESKKNS